MKILIDVPEPQLAELTALAQSQGVSRAEAVRNALAMYLEAERKPVAAFIGLWARHGSVEDGMEYQDRMRSEW